MANVQKQIMRAVGALNIRLYRASGGRVMGKARSMASVSIAGREEHSILWAKLVAKAPFFGKYETKPGRQIPIATLTPTD